MSPRVILGEVPASSLVCQGGHCWGKARGTGNLTGFIHKRLDIPAWICLDCAQSTDGERRGHGLGAGTSPSLLWSITASQDCPHKTERGAHLIGCQQWLAEGFSPVDGEPGTGYLHPPGREIPVGMSILGRASHNDTPQQKPRRSFLCQHHPGKDSHAPSLHSDSRTGVSGTASSENCTGMGHPGAGAGSAALTHPPLGRALTCWGRSQTAAPARRGGPGCGDATPGAAG